MMTCAAHMGLVSAFARAGVPLPQGYSAASCKRLGPGASGARAGRVAALVELCNVSAQCSLCLPPYEQTQWPADDQWVPLCYPCYSAFRPCRRVTLSDAHPDGDVSSRVVEWAPLTRAEFADRFVAYYRRRQADDAVRMTPRERSLRQEIARLHEQLATIMSASNQTRNDDQADDVTLPANRGTESAEGERRAFKDAQSGPAAHAD
jgi:hypothetical protein